MGYYFFKYKDVVIEKLNKWGVKMIVLFLIAFLTATIAKDKLDQTLWQFGRFDIIVKILVRIIHLLAAVLGVIVAYYLSNWYVQKHIQIPGFFVCLNTYCFGMYLFQQFILQILYYNTPLFVTVGPFWSPWVAIIITLILSYFFTLLLRLTRVGRFIIG